MKKRVQAEFVFRVYPEQRSRLHIRVLVYWTVADLRRAMREVRGRCDTSGVLGFCRGVLIRTNRGRTRPVFAEIGLTFSSRTTVITHEAYHATCRWAARRKLAPLSFTLQGADVKGQSLIEERLAETHDAICRGIVHNLYRLNVLK